MKAGGLVLFWMLAATSVAVAEELAPSAIAEAVERLGSDTYQVREHASDFLWREGESARDALTEATRSNDREVVFRAKELLERLDAGCGPIHRRRRRRCCGRTSWRMRRFGCGFWISFVESRRSTC